MTKIFTKYNQIYPPAPIDQSINIVTCTYPRKYRINFLTHLKNILVDIPDIRWIIVDDNDKYDEELKQFLPDFAIYLKFGPTKDKGNAQRNHAWEYIYDNNLDGIIYNADDDNVYDPRLFQEIRKTKSFGIMPVGNLSTRDGQTERPILDKNGKFKGWNSYWQRKYATDMAGFCFNVKLLDKIKKPFWNHKGFAGETEFISKILKSPNEMEFLCDNCTNTYVWHNLLLDSLEIKAETIINIKSKEEGSKFGKTSGTIEQYNEIQEKIFNNNITENNLKLIENIFLNTVGVYDSPDRVELSMLAKLINNISNGYIIEYGCWRGRTTCILSKFKSDDSKLFVVDHFESSNGLQHDPNSKEDNIKEFNKTIEKHNIQDTFTLIDKDSTKIRWSEFLNKKNVKLIFYDGDPNFNIIKKSILNIMPYVDNDCILVFHDASWQGVKAIIKLLCDKYNYKIKIYINIWEGLAILSK